MNADPFSHHNLSGGGRPVDGNAMSSVGKDMKLNVGYFSLDMNHNNDVLHSLLI